MKLSLYKRSGRCIICTKKNCGGCEILKNYENLESLKDIYNEIYILALWNDEFLYNDPNLEEPDNIETCTIHDCFTKYTEIESIESKCEECGHCFHDSQIEI